MPILSNSAWARADRHAPATLAGGSARSNVAPMPADGELQPASDAKRRAALAALEYVRPNTVVGLGSGSTAALFIAELGRRVKTGQIEGIEGVATSLPSEALARQAGIPLVDPAQGVRCDVVVDGADEVADNLDLVKGRGGALVREKIVAQASDRRVIIVDEGKCVPRLGEKCPLPVEVLRWGHDWQADFLRGLGGDPVLRLARGDRPVVTDNGHYIYDVAFGPIADPAELERRLLDRGGVVQTGLFLGMADVVLVAGADGTVTARERA